VLVRGADATLLAPALDHGRDGAEPISGGDVHRFAALIVWGGAQEHMATQTRARIAEEPAAFCTCQRIWL